MTNRTPGQLLREETIVQEIYEQTGFKAQENQPLVLGSNKRELPFRQAPSVLDSMLRNTDPEHTPASEANASEDEAGARQIETTLRDVGFTITGMTAAFLMAAKIELIAEKAGILTEDEKSKGIQG